MTPTKLNRERLSISFSAAASSMFLNYTPEKGKGKGINSERLPGVYSCTGRRRQERVLGFAFFAFH
jgi:hypothetical protein